MGRSKCLLLCLALLHAGSPAAAQVPLQVMQELSRQLKPGDTVYVSQANMMTQGKLVGVTASSLAVEVGGTHRNFDMATVTRVERERSAVKKGALIGLLAGGVTFGAMAAVAANRCTGVNCNYGPGMSSDSGLFMVAFGVGAGAGAGAAIGVAIKHRQTVFEAPARSVAPTASLAPLISVGTRFLGPQRK